MNISFFIALVVFLFSSIFAHAQAIPSSQSWDWDFYPLYKEVKRGIFCTTLTENKTETELELELYNAVNRGDNTLVTKLLSCEVDPNIPLTRGLNVLVPAVARNDFEMVKLLLAAGAKPDGYNDSALVVAASFARLEMVELLLKVGANAKGNEYYSLNISPILAAAQMAGVEVSLPPRDLEEAMLARYEILKLLIENGANVNDVDPHRRTVLRLASYRQHQRTTDLLLEKGAQMEALTSQLRF